MRAFNVLLSLLVLVVLLLLALEGSLRLLGMGPPPTLNQFDEHVGWSKKPGASLTRRGEGFQASFELNELGLRGAPMSSPAKPPGIFRVLLLGDSFTLGYTVEFEDSFVEVLADTWRREGRDIDVINAGTEGYSTDQQAAWLLQHGAEFEPDLVVLVPYDNDIYYNGQDHYQRFPKPMFSPTGELKTGVLADPGSGGWKRTTAIGQQLAGRPSADSFRPAGGSQDIAREFAPLLVEAPAFLDEALARTRGSLIAIQRQCAELDVPLVVAPIPSHSAVDPDFAAQFGQGYLGLPPARWSADKPVETVLGFCAELGITALDARQALRAATGSGADKQDQYLNFFESLEWHFNPAGNRTFADFLAAELDRAGAVPTKVSDTVATAAAPTAGQGGGAPTWLMVFASLWVVLSGLYMLFYRDEALWLPPLKVGAILAAVFVIVLGGEWLLGLLSPEIARWVLIVFIALIVGFVVYKLGRRFMTILELIKAFMLRGHWYLMPLVVILLTIGSLLVVAASSPLVAPFIYTLF